jgi:hypothetical protein
MPRSICVVLKESLRYASATGSAPSGCFCARGGCCDAFIHIAFEQGYALITIRADSVEALLQRWPELGLDSPKSLYLPPLSSVAYRDVILKPAAVYSDRAQRLTVEPVLAPSRRRAVFAHLEMNHTGTFRTLTGGAGIISKPRCSPLPRKTRCGFPP